MTEERKQELRQLLEEATKEENLEIRRSKAGVSLPSIDVSEYKELLLHRWVSHSENSRLVWENFELDVISKTTKSKLLDFIREEYAPFIHEDRIQSVCSFISGSPGDGYPLAALLKQLLNIAIGRGIERAVSNFDEYTKETHASVRYMALLEGIRIETKIQVLEGIQLIPLANSSSDLPYFLPTSMISVVGLSANFFCNKALLITDHLISPGFHSPLQSTTIRKHLFYNFRVNVNDVFENVCQALSLACNSAVQISLKWPFWPEDELFYLTRPGPGPPQFSAPPGLFAHPAEVGEADIKEAKRLYKILDKNSDIRGKLQIPINRWIKSKTLEEPIDKIIDLGIAFEALYLSDIPEPTELSFRLRLHAAWHLGESEEDRKGLMKEFSEIYNWRSKVVHTGKLPNKTKKTPFTHKEVQQFIENAQDRCRESILKILEDGKFPDWNSLILGGEEEQASS